MKIKRVELYRVRQGAEIPEDMLRYDCAFVHDQLPDVVAFPVFQTRDGNLGGRVTHGRWQSFMLRLNKIPDEDAREILFEYPVNRDWYTYRHPRTPFNGNDYGSLERVSIETYMEHRR